MPPNTPRLCARPPARKRNGSPHPHHRKFASYHRSVRLIKPNPASLSSLTSDSSPNCSSTSRKNLATKEVDTRSSPPCTANPRTPGHRISRHQNTTPPRQMLPRMPPPRPPLTPSPPAYAASNCYEHIEDGDPGPTFDTYFLEDPHWRNALFLNEVEEFEATGNEKRNTDHTDPKAPGSLGHKQSDSTTRGRYYRNGSTSAQLRSDCPSPDRASILQRRNSCSPVQFQNLAIGRSAHRLKNRIAQKKWLSKRIRNSLKSKIPTQTGASGRVCVPKQVLIGRDLHSRSNTLDDYNEAESGELITVGAIDVKSLENTIIDPVLDDLLHNPSVSRFSDDWAAHWIDYQYSADPIKDHRTGKSNKLAPFEQDNHRHPMASRNLSITHISNQPRKDIRKFSSHANDLDDTLAPFIRGHRQHEARLVTKHTSPAVQSHLLGKENLQRVRPEPGPRTSSRAKVDGPILKANRDLSGKALPSLPNTVSENTRSRAVQANTSRRKRAESTTTQRPHRPRSTDTLTKIEAQVPSNRLPSADVNTMPIRVSMTPPSQLGPSGSPPERALPKLPEGAESSSAKGTRERTHPHSRRHSHHPSNLSRHTRDRSSVSTLSTVRAISPATTQRSSATIPEGVAGIFLLAEETPSKPDLRVNTTEASLNQHPHWPGILRSPISFHTPKAPPFTNAAPTHIVQQQVKRAARAERVRALKKRDLAPKFRIKEKDEGDDLGPENPVTTPPTQVLDPLDQFPTVPCSRSDSRTSRNARNGSVGGVRRQSIAARWSPEKDLSSPQVLGQSGIMVMGEAESKGLLATSTVKKGRGSGTTGTLASSPPQQDQKGENAALSTVVVVALDHRTIPMPIRPPGPRRTETCPAKVPSGDDTPPLSATSSSTSGGDEGTSFSSSSLAATTIEGRRLEILLFKLRSEVQHFVSLQDEKRMLQDRKIEKMHRLVGLLQPSGSSKSRGRDGDEGRLVNGCVSTSRLREVVGGNVGIGRVVSEPVFGAIGISGPGPAVAEDLMPRVERRRESSISDSSTSRRFTAVVSTAKVECMLDSMQRSPEFGLAGAIHRSPVKVRSAKRLGRQGENRVKGRSGDEGEVRMLWLQNE